MGVRRVAQLLGGGGGGGGPTTLAGDVQGPSGSNVLDAIQGNLLNLSGLANGDVLTYLSGNWVNRPGSGAILQDKAFFVDATLGNDSTGTRNNRAFPFRTITAVFASGTVLTGDSIYLLTDINESVIVPPGLQVGFNGVLSTNCQWTAPTGSVPLTINNTCQLYNIHFAGDNATTAVDLIGSGSEFAFLYNVNTENPGGSHSLTSTGFTIILDSCRITDRGSHVDNPFMFFINAGVFDSGAQTFDNSGAVGEIYLESGNLGSVTLIGDAQWNCGGHIGDFDSSAITGNGTVGMGGGCGDMTIGPQGSVQFLNLDVEGAFTVNAAGSSFLVSGQNVSIAGPVALGANITFDNRRAIMNATGVSFGVGSLLTNITYLDQAGHKFWFVDPDNGVDQAARAGASVPFRTAQAAHDAMSPGDFIVIMTSYLQENLTITKSCTVLGYGTTTRNASFIGTTIQGGTASPTTPTVTVTAASVKFWNINLQGQDGLALMATDATLGEAIEFENFSCVKGNTIAQAARIEGFARVTAQGTLNHIGSFQIVALTGGSTYIAMNAYFPDPFFQGQLVIDCTASTSQIQFYGGQYAPLSLIGIIDLYVAADVTFFEVEMSGVDDSSTVEFHGKCMEQATVKAVVGGSYSGSKWFGNVGTVPFATGGLDLNFRGAMFAGSFTAENGNIVNFAESAQPYSITTNGSAQVTGVYWQGNTVPITGSLVTVTFPNPVYAGNYNVTITPNQTGNGDIAVYNKSSTSFDVVFSLAPTGTFDWAMTVVG